MYELIGNERIGFERLVCPLPGGVILVAAS